MKNGLGWMLLVVLCCAARVEAAEVETDARLVEAQAAFDEASNLREVRRHSDAIQKVEHALALREAALGATHPEVAACLNLLGNLFYEQESMARAEAILLRALAIREATLGNHHPDVAQSLNNLGGIYQRQGLYAQAEALYARALAIREASLGKNHSDVAHSLFSLGHLHHERGLYAQAESLYKRTLAIRAATLGENHPDIARSLHNLASLYYEQGLYTQAKSLYLRALAIQESSLGTHHPDVAHSLHNLGGIYQRQGQYAQAEPLYERALVIREVSLGKGHPDVAQSLYNLGCLYHEQGMYARAEILYERALVIQEARLGTRHPGVAHSLHGLALLYFEQGLYAQAEPLYKRALAIREASLGENHPDVAHSLHNLAGIYQEQGLYARAESLYERALAIREANLGKNHPDVAHSLHNLALLYSDQTFFTRAKPLHERALAIWEGSLGKNHPYVAYSLNSIASLHQQQGRYVRAESLYKRALAIQQASLGENHPHVAHSLQSIADLYRQLGLYARARPLHIRALAIREAILGKHHPDVAKSLSSIARLHIANHLPNNAVPILTRAFSISEQRLRQEALAFSESRLATFILLLRHDEEYIYALTRAHPDNTNVQRLALSSVLLRKGRTTEEIAGTSRTINHSLAAEDRDTFERLRGLRAQLAQFSLNGPGPLSPAEYQQRLQALEDQGDTLEADLARRSAPLRALTALPPPAEIVDRVAASLPPGSALVEFVAYGDWPLVPKPSSAAPQMRYLAMVLFPDASIRTVDLGSADRVDRAASELRNALARRDAAYQGPAQKLYALAVQPLRPILGNTRRVFLAPDGQLGLVPFDVLHDGKQFLIDSFDFSYLTSGKDLLPRAQALPAAKSVVVVADPAFDALPDVGSSAAGDAAPEPQRSPALERFYSTLHQDRAWKPWGPLPGTRREAEAIQRLHPQARLLLGTEATKQRLLQLPPPGILHIATHGFFLDDPSGPKHARALGQVGSLANSSPLQTPTDPLLRSGLVLAGAQASTQGDAAIAQPPAENAVVTALEFAGLDLWGTQLVVLSACDTGRGDVKLGQGVYGLRRAFIIAGAETVVMSLWKVNDDSTHLLMEDYYRHLLAGRGRAEALRDAMRKLRETRPHPYYWAPFIALGRDAPLQSLTPAP